MRLHRFGRSGSVLAGLVLSLWCPGVAFPQDGPAAARSDEIEKLRQELAALRQDYQSRVAAIEQRLGVRVSFFSYPKGSLGDFSDELEAHVREAGYAASFATLPGSNALKSPVRHAASGVLSVKTAAP